MEWFDGLFKLFFHSHLWFDLTCARWMHSPNNLSISEEIQNKILLKRLRLRDSLTDFHASTFFTWTTDGWALIMHLNILIVFTSRQRDFRICLRVHLKLEIATKRKLLLEIFSCRERRSKKVKSFKFLLNSRAFLMMGLNWWILKCDLKALVKSLES